MLSASIFFLIMSWLFSAATYGISLLIILDAFWNKTSSFLRNFNETLSSPYAIWVLLMISLNFWRSKLSDCNLWIEYQSSPSRYDIFILVFLTLIFKLVIINWIVQNIKGNFINIIHLLGRLFSLMNFLFCSNFYLLNFIYSSRRLLSLSILSESWEFISDLFEQLLVFSLGIDCLTILEVLGASGIFS